MDYLRWLLLNKHRRFFVDGVFVPIVFLNLILIGISFSVSIILGTLVSIISILLWSIPLFLFFRELYNESVKEYNKSKNMP